MQRLILVGCVLLGACSAQPVPYHSQNEIPQGPGLLTGAEGGFVLRADAGAPRGAAGLGDAGNSKAPTPAR